MNVIYPAVRHIFAKTIILLLILMLTVLSIDFRTCFPLNETGSHLLSYCFRRSAQTMAVLQNTFFETIKVRHVF